VVILNQRICLIEIRREQAEEITVATVASLLGRKKDMRALIDGDVLLYSIGYTTEDEDVGIAYIRMNEKIADIIIATSANDYQIFLSDSAENNFRYSLFPEYKANRTQPKPIHYEALKEYLILKHNAKIAYGMEADDAMGIGQMTDPEKTIICTIDKDLNIIPGKHYSWEITRKGVVVRPESVYEVVKLEGLKFFYKQMLIGDSTDNIKGITGIGKKKADALIDPCETEKDMFDTVSKKFLEEFKEDWQKQMELTGRLLWILQHEEDSWKLADKIESFGTPEQA
jgi:5'-3' exonuclease